MKVTYDMIWEFAAERANAERNTKSIDKYITTILDCVLLQSRQFKVCSEMRNRGRLHVDRLVKKSRPHQALCLRPDSEARKAPLSNLTPAVVTLWLLTGWRIDAISAVRNIELDDNFDILVDTPPLKHHPTEHEVTRIQCMCSAYRCGTRCMTCSCEIPTTPIKVPPRVFMNSHHSSHSFRKTLATALLLAINHYGFETKSVAYKVNSRLKWFKLGPDGTTISNVISDNLQMLHYYGSDCGSITWENLETSMKRIALEILIEPSTIDSPGDRLYEHEKKWYIVKGKNHR